MEARCVLSLTSFKIGHERLDLLAVFVVLPQQARQVLELTFAGTVGLDGASLLQFLADHSA